MTDLVFRNVDVDAASPVRDWPFEAIQAAMERGTLRDWRRLADEIRRSPWGRVARAVEEVASWGDIQGVDALMLESVTRARAAVTRAGRTRWAAHLATMRRDAGLTLRELAALAGTSASRLSDYEHGRVAPTTDALSRVEHAVAVAQEERTSQRGDRSSP
jgi:DNA-binding transcriptional regulator YiaG